MAQQLRPPRGIARGGVANARDLRRRMTLAETQLWDGRLQGLKFRRQHPIGPFVLDFCCPAAWLGVELDGAVHDEQVEQDEYRTQMLAASGYRVIRFRNEEVFSNLGSVLERIRQAATEGQRSAALRPVPGIDGSPLPRTGEGPGVRAFSEAGSEVSTSPVPDPGPARSTVVEGQDRLPKDER